MIRGQEKAKQRQTRTALPDAIRGSAFGGGDG